MADKTSKTRSATVDLSAVEGALQLLARAVRQFHTYPATSPLCVDAVMACHDALKSIRHRDRVASRIAPNELIVDDVHVGAGTVVEQELTRRLFRLRVASLEIECGASARDLSRFCIDLVESDDPADAELTFADRLAEHGVGTIVPVMARRPVVVNVGVTPPHTVDLLALERRRQQEVVGSDGPVSHLYPPDRGWIRSDPGQALGNVSLLDLVILVDDPGDIASMLVRLTGEEADGPEGRQSALERKYSDITRLFSALDPRLAQMMFGKLARAVLELAPERRTTLLQRTILPGLLDGRADGQVLRDFPDMDLAEAICLLLDLETAAPEVLSAALDRLDLTTDRRAALVPLIEQRMQVTRGGRLPDAGADEASGIERYARQLVRVDPGQGNDFSEFAAFDLSLDAQALAIVSGVRTEIAGTDLLMAQLQCVSQLMRIERNPTLVDSFARRGLELLGALERDGRWPEVIETAVSYAALARELRTRRPDVADMILKALADYCTPSRLMALAALHGRDEHGRSMVTGLIEALGASIVPGFVALMNRSAHEPPARALVPIVCELAPALGLSLAAELDACGAAAARVIAKVLGHAGPGHEAPIARLAEHHDQQVAREALRALARIGTASAAMMVARQLRDGSSDRHPAAEDALWHFAPAQIANQLRELLRQREFVFAHPQTAARLIDRARQTRVQGLDDALTKLEGLRFRFWNPSLVQVAIKARELRAR